MASKPRRANLKGPGKCIFCGNGGLTHEHMWADWLKRYIPRPDAHHATARTLVHPDFEDQTIVKRRTGDFYARRIYCVCGACNSGWMSRLQEEVRPYLVPMLEGRAITLHRRAQRLLSAWIAMMVMVAEFVEPERDMIAISPSDRAFLRTEKKPPHHWRIWIGAHNNKSFPLYNHYVSEFVEDKSKGSPDGLSHSPNTQTTTICVGDHLVVFVMSSAIGRSIIRRWVLPTQIRSGMHQIWPPSMRSGDVRWNTDRRLTDQGVALLANHFFDRAAEIAARR